MPADDTTTDRSFFQAAALETLIANLRNAHALEKQVATVLEGQVKLLPDYPELKERISEHIFETREQARRLEAALEICGTSTSIVKDALLSAMGIGQSSVQGFADDAVLKAMAADVMTEHLEIATYRTLIDLADLAGKPELKPRLEESLREEEAMAEWLGKNLSPVTRRFIDIKAAVEKAGSGSKPASSAGDDKDQTMWQTLENAKKANVEAEEQPQTPAQAAGSKEKPRAARPETSGARSDG